ncbi:hypothetical protein NT6N_12420 [Oceaniferula spumae]|uniref:SLA1 homology domain-containing protein n=1 Tax=Oceaniferula spumae TaxID=2979115 RepID=A0AAT9FJU4_9BACT
MSALFPSFLRHSLVLLLFAALANVSQAEQRRFQNKEETKSFFAELNGYDAKTKIVTVRMSNGRQQRFPIDILSDDDQKYVLENARRLAIGNEIRVTLRKFQDKSKKELKERIVDRVSPSGYEVSLNNRAKRTFKDIKLNYTLYYEVQDYLKPEREQKTKEGTLECKAITSQQTITLKTETVDIVSGKLDPVIKNVRRRGADGSDYIEPVVEKPGGRRKDLLIGCKLDVVVDGEVVKSITDGTIQIESPEDNS